MTDDETYKHVTRRRTKPDTETDRDRQQTYRRSMANGVAFITFSRSAVVLPPPLHPPTFIRHRGKTVTTSIDFSVSHELHFGRTCSPNLRLGKAPLRWTSHPFAFHRATRVSFDTAIVCTDHMVDVGVQLRAFLLRDDSTLSAVRPLLNPGYLNDISIP